MFLFCIKQILVEVVMEICRVIILHPNIKDKN